MNTQPTRSNRPHALSVRATPLLSLLFTALAVLTGIGPLAAPAATASSAGTTCSAFNRYPDSSWYKAQQYLNTLPHGYSASAQAARHLLDADRDGYACEHLAVLTAALGEPSCTGRLWWRDCSGRDMYRKVTHLTHFGDARALRGALLDVYLPYALNPAQANMATMLADAVNYPSPCQREVMQTFIRNRVSEQKMSKAFTTTLGLGEKVAERATKMNPAAPYAYAVEQYLKAAGKAYEAVIGVARYDAALTSANNARTCVG